MNPLSNPRHREARRENAGLEVALLWSPGDNKMIVCVTDRREGAYFEIPAEPCLALDVYHHHQFTYRDFINVDYQDDRLAA